MSSSTLLLLALGAQGATDEEPMRPLFELPATVPASELGAALAALPPELSLRVRDQGRDAAFVGALVTSPSLAGVVVLDLSGNPLGPAGGAALASARGLLALETLNLADTGLGDEGATALSNASLPALRTLILDQCGVGRRGAEALASSPLLDSVRVLSMAGISDLWEGGHPKPFLGPKGLAALVSSPRLAALEELSVPLSAIGDTGAAAIANASELTSLRRLNLRANDIGDAGAIALAGAPHLMGIELLDLRDNPISADAEAKLRVVYGDRLLR